MLASCPALSKGPERVCVLPKITQQLSRLAFQRLDALWCPPQGSTPLSFYRYYGGALKFAKLELKTQLQCVHTPLASACRNPSQDSCPREGSLSTSEGCSSCNKKRGA